MNNDISLKSILKSARKSVGNNNLVDIERISKFKIKKSQLQIHFSGKILLFRRILQKID